MARLPAVALGLCLVGSPAAAQETFRCTTPDGKVTYQQTPCPKASEERKVDITPANPNYDPKAREELLKQGEEAGKRLEAREAAEEAARKQRALDAQREREAQQREEARDNPDFIYARPPGWRPGPYPPRPAHPAPRPAPGKS